MATRNSTGADRAITRSSKLADETNRVLLNASFQMEGLFEALIQKSHDMELADNMADIAVMRALAIRGKALNGAGMSLLGDPDSSLEESQEVVENG